MITDWRIFSSSEGSFHYELKSVRLLRKSKENTSINEWSAIPFVLSASRRRESMMKIFNRIPIAWMRLKASRWIDSCRKNSLAIIYAAQKFRYYMLAHKIKLVVGANPIRYLLSRPALSGRKARWLLQLSEFDIECVTPKAAIKGQVFADLLASFPSKDPFELSEEIPGQAWKEVLVQPQTQLRGSLSLPRYVNSTILLGHTQQKCWELMLFITSSRSLPQSHSDWFRIILRTTCLAERRPTKRRVVPSCSWTKQSFSFSFVLNWMRPCTALLSLLWNSSAYCSWPAERLTAAYHPS